MIPLKEILYNTKRKLIILMFLLYFPGLSLVVGAPIPMPSAVSVTEEQIALFNFFSLMITLIGTAVGVGFYLERRTNHKIEEVEKMISEFKETIYNQIKDLKQDMKDMEIRIHDSVISKAENLEKSVIAKADNLERDTENKVKGARELIDTRFKHVEEMMKSQQKAIDFIQQFQFGQASKSIPPYLFGDVETQEHKDKESQGMYKSPDSSETQDHKDSEARGDNEQLSTRLKREKASKDRWDEEATKQEGDKK